MKYSGKRLVRKGGYRSRSVSKNLRRAKRSLRRAGRKVLRRAGRTIKRLVKKNRKTGRGTKKRVVRRRRSNRMRGGAIEYSPLPCHADGTTDWNSAKQVGHETCVEYGTDGAELDARATGLGAGKLADMDIEATIKDAVDAALASRGTKPITQAAIDVAGASDEAAAEAARIAAERAAQNPS